MNRFPSSFVRSSINISLPSAWIHNYVAAGIASVTKVGVIRSLKAFQEPRTGCTSRLINDGSAKHWKPATKWDRVPKERECSRLDTLSSNRRPTSR
jgi:hypothetical protein